MKRHRESKYIYAAYEKGGEGLCIANADTAQELGQMLGISKDAVLHRAKWRTDQSRSKYIIQRIEA